MYDPTIFENLKVALENQIYDLDNIEGRIKILDRTDTMDFASISRELTLQFGLAKYSEIYAQVVLRAGVEDLAGEILELVGKDIGCTLILRIYMKVQDIPEQCARVEQALNGIWENDVHITQTLSFLYGEESTYINTIEIIFQPKINEDNMNEIPDFLESVIETLEIIKGI